MSPVLQSAQLFLLAGTAFLAIGALTTALLIHTVGDRVLRWEPQVRHRALMGLALLPVVLATCLLFAASLPSLLALGLPALDHCPTHDDDHAHLCFVHLPKLSIHLGLTLGLVCVIGYALMRAALSAATILRATRILESLSKTGLRRTELGITVIETSQPVCFTAGLFRPEVLISRGLLELLKDEERAVVLAHEQAHVRRRDALVAIVVRACVAFHLPKIAGWLVRELELAAEQVCDEEAGSIAGDRIAVAAAILAVQRAAQTTATRQLGAVTVAFGEHAVERRVESLLSEPLPSASLGWCYIVLALVATTLLLFADRLHHATESLLSAIVH